MRPKPTSKGNRSPSKGHTEKPGHQDKADRDAVKAWFPLPQKYEDPEKSGLAFAISSGLVDQPIALK